MAEKEDYIVISKKDFDYKKGHYVTHLAKQVSSQEAINRMAKAIHYYEWAHDKHFPKWDELNSDIQNDYKNMAKAALNAILEGN